MGPSQYFTLKRLEARERGDHPSVLFHFTPRSRALQILEDGYLRGRPALSLTENPAFVSPGPVVFAIDTACVRRKGFDLLPYIWLESAAQEAEWIVVPAGIEDRSEALGHEVDLPLGCVKYVGLVGRHGAERQAILEMAEAMGIPAGDFDWEEWWGNGPKTGLGNAYLGGKRPFTPSQMEAMRFYIDAALSGDDYPLISAWEKLQKGRPLAREELAVLRNWLGYAIDLSGEDEENRGKLMDLRRARERADAILEHMLAGLGLSGALTCSPELRQFGKDLKAFLHSDEALRLISGFCVADMGWTTGVCGILADGMARWLGPDAELWAMWGDLPEEKGRRAIVHAVVKIDGCFLDAEGAVSEHELLSRWRERVGDPELKKFPKRTTHILRHPQTSRQIAKALEARFGSGKR